MVRILMNACVLLVSFFLWSRAYTQTVSNVFANQQGEDIAILYSLQTQEACEVFLYISTDRGSSWQGPLGNCTGDIGKNIPAGSHKILWSVLKDCEQLVGNGIQFKVVARGDVTAETVLNNYITAIGGKDKIRAIKSYEQQCKYWIGAMELDMNIKVKDNAKYALYIQMNGMEVMKQVFDGTKGVTSQMGQKADMSEDELRAARQQLDMLFEINYPKHNISAFLNGIVTIDGKDAYVIERRDFQGNVTTDYYDVNSGLKLKSISVNKDGVDFITVETIFLDYKEYNGVKFPVSQKQLMGAQEFRIQVSNVIINPKFDDAAFRSN